MDILEFRRLTDLLARTPIGELEIEEGGRKIRLIRRAGFRPMQPVSSQQQAEESDESKSAPLPAAQGGLICSPSYGIFHLTPAPGAPPYVTLGTAVDVGQQVGLIEAMKVFNAVKATQAGQIEEILVQNGAEVEAGSPLFRLT